MKKKMVPALLVLLLSGCLCTAQPPGIGDSILSIKKKWKKTPPFVGAYDPQLKPAQFPLLYKRTDSIAALVQEAYPDPTGTEAMWYVSIIGDPYFTGGPSPYVYNSIFNYYYYNKGLGKVLRHGEPGTGVNIYVNEFRFLLDKTGLVAQVNGRSKTLFKLLNSEGEWKGYPVYRVHENFVGYKNYRTVFFGRNGQQPWKAASRIEFLEALRAKWKEDEQKTISSLEEGEVKARKMIEDLKADQKMTKDLKEKMLTAAQAGLDNQLAMKKKNIQAARTLVEKEEKKIDEYIRTHTDDELQQPAVVNQFGGVYSWQKFEEQGSKSGQRVVYIDQSYFDKSLPSYIPQFFTLSWQWQDDTAPLYFKEQFETNFPVGKLQGMLDRYIRPGKEVATTEETIRSGIETIVRSISGPNDASTWALVKNKVTSFLTFQWKEGKLQGNTVAQAFYVKADATTMTQQDIQQGRLIVETGLAFRKPGEFETSRIVKQL